MSELRPLKSYDKVASFYDTMSSVFSGGQILATKHDQLNFLSAGQDVAYLGCGSGLDVLAGARHGCNVTAVDTSQKMLDKLKRRLDRENLSGRLVCDFFQNLGQEQFDALCCNFFFNCFPHDTMTEFVADATKHVRPGGRIMIADVAPPSGSFVGKTVNKVYLHGAMLPFWMMGMVHWHANHDYTKTLADLGWKVEHIQPFRLLKFGPVVFRNIVASAN